MDGERVFGYSYFGRRFLEILRVSSEGLTFKQSRQIAWRDIVAYRAFPDFAFDLVLAFLASSKPRVWLYLANGDVIRLRGDLLVAGSSDTPAASRRSAFDDVIGELQQRGLPAWKGPRDETVLLSAAWALFVCGGVVVAWIAHLFTSFSIAGAAIIGGVISAQLAFALAPPLARRARRTYIENALSRSGNLPA